MKKLLICGFLALIVLVSCDQEDSLSSRTLSQKAGFEVLVPSNLPDGIKDPPETTITDDHEFGKSLVLVFRGSQGNILRLTESEAIQTVPLDYTEAIEISGYHIFLTSKDEHEWWAHFQIDNTDIFAEYRTPDSNAKEIITQVIKELLSQKG